MKKLLTLCLAVAASALLFAACAGNTDTKEAEGNETTNPTTAPTYESDEDIIIEPVTLKTEPEEDITEDWGEIGEDEIEEGIPDDDIPEEIEEGGEIIEPESSSEEPV